MVKIEELSKEIEETKEEVRNDIKVEKKKINVKEKIVGIWKKIFMHPEDAENKFLNWFDSKKKVAFLTALIVGILTHITFITEMLLSQDGLWNSLTYSVPTNWEIILGRWGIFLADFVVNYLAIPNITSVISILVIAISTVFVIDVLKLKNTIIIFLASCAMVVSPALTSTMIYAYTSVAYCIAMLISVLTVWLIFKKTDNIFGRIFNIVLALVLMVLSLGIYQSYMGVVIGLTVMRLLKDLFDNEISVKWFFIHGLIMVFVVIVGGLLYSRITEHIWEKLELEGASYKGMESISIENTLNNLSVSIPKIYNDFKEFYFGESIVFNKNYKRHDFYKLMFEATLILELIAIFANKIYKKFYKIPLIILMTLVIPIALNSVLLLTTETSTYILTAAQLILIIPFAGMICEIAGKKCTFIFRWATIISMFLIVFTYYLADNVSYHILKQTYNQAYTTAIRIVDRIEQTQGYTPDRLVMINGIIEPDMNYRYQKSSNLYDYTIGTLFRDCPVFHGTYTGMEGTWMKFFSNYMGMRVQLCGTGDYLNLLKTEEYKNMGVFPAADSVKFIGHVVVVKLREEAIMP